MNFLIDNQKISVIFSADLQLKDPQDWQFFQYELHEASVKNWCAVTVQAKESMQIIHM
jgi:hypothetical protein